MDCRYAKLKKIPFYFLILLIAGSSIRIATVTAKLYQGMQAPAFELNDLNGKGTTLAHLSAGKKLTAVVFWTLWNEQSPKELLRLQKFFEQYQSRGFQAVAINVEDQNISKGLIKKISALCKDLGITFPVLIDRGLATFHSYTIIAIPTTFLIDKEQTIVYKLPGYPMTGAEQLFATMRGIMAPEDKKISSAQIQQARLPDSKAIRYFQMAKVLQNNENHSGAIVSLRKSINIDPDFLDPYNLLATILHQQGETEEALAIFNQAFARNPNDLLFRAQYGNFLLQAGHAEKGKAVIEKVLQEDPNFSMAHYYLGNFHLQQGEKDQALRQVQSAVKTNPLDFKIHRLLGSVFESMGRKQESLAAYKKAADILEKQVKSNDFSFLSLVLTSKTP